MPNKSVEEIFEKMSSVDYDKFNENLRPISDNLHFLCKIVLKDVPADANVLCVGVGTGAEILELGNDFPNWRFTGVDPSASMLEGCRARLETQGLTDRCQLFNGYLSELELNIKFDAVFCFFVMHFVQDKSERLGIFKEMFEYLKPGGIMLNAEISYDMSSPLFPDLLERWKDMQILAGTPPERAEKIPESFKNFLSVLSPEETERMIQEGGFPHAIRFFQSLLIHGWYAKKL